MKPFVITLPYPVSANAYWATRVIPANRTTGKPAMAITYVTKEAEAYKQTVAWMLRGAGVRDKIRGRVFVGIQLYAKRPLDWQKRQRKLGAEWDNSVQRMDLDNARKVLNDSLKDIVIEDDFWIWKDEGEVMEPDEHGARIVVTIKSVAKEQPQTGLFGEAA